MPCELLKGIKEDNVPASVDLTFLYDRMKLDGYVDSDEILKGIKLSIEYLTNNNK